MDHLVPHRYPGRHELVNLLGLTSRCTILLFFAHPVSHVQAGISRACGCCTKAAAHAGLAKPRLRRGFWIWRLLRFFRLDNQRLSGSALQALTQ